MHAAVDAALAILPEVKSDTPWLSSDTVRISIKAGHAAWHDNVCHHVYMPIVCLHKTARQWLTIGPHKLLTDPWQLPGLDQDGGCCSAGLGGSQTTLARPPCRC